MVALKTFKNLSEERKEQLIAASLQEFALHDYETASLSNIVERIGLAKGSFYRYFESKRSLYIFLVDHCIQKRVANDEHIINKDMPDFFELLAQHFAAKFSFDKKFPLHSAFLFNVLQERRNDELGDIQLYSKGRVLDLIKLMVAEWVKKGFLRNDIAHDAIAFLILQVQLSIFDYIALHYKIDFIHNIKEHGMLYDLPESELLRISRQFVDLLKNGLFAKQIQ